MKTSIELIGNERLRQMIEEGFDSGHDNQHHNGELLKAAISYGLAAIMQDRQSYPDSVRDTLNKTAEQLWPWDLSWWKPTPRDRVRQLVKAGALIAAEIDRIQSARLLVCPNCEKPGCNLGCT